ncbi:RDD family protein [Planctomicrobium sp. SH661]|uniref:RDD family protein n=1 Tax=Planctomicrobium sp. SH661 TaxID=3448124 RepID=UPI003F5C6437
MADQLKFETPENVQVRYTPAGLGTRFVAWVIDQVFVSLLMFVLLIVLTLSGMSFFTVIDRIDTEHFQPHEVIGFVIAVAVILMGLGSFVYFAACELLMGGQTPGKRMCQIRVIKVDGFSLDPGSILIRNLFRVADNIPCLWIVPFLSKRSQRTGDMVAGTTVVSDGESEMSDLRSVLSEKSAADAEFRFDSRTLGRLGPGDFDAVERLLERWQKIPEKQREELLDKLVSALLVKLQIPAPLPERRLRFLEDLMAAELRAQHRSLL